MRSEERFFLTASNYMQGHHCTPQGFVSRQASMISQCQLTVVTTNIESTFYFGWDMTSPVIFIYFWDMRNSSGVTSRMNMLTVARSPAYPGWAWTA